MNSKVKNVNATEWWCGIRKKKKIYKTMRNIISSGNLSYDVMADYIEMLDIRHFWNWRRRNGEKEWCSFDLENKKKKNLLKCPHITILRFLKFFRHFITFCGEEKIGSFALFLNLIHQFLFCFHIQSFVLRQNENESIEILIHLMEHNIYFISIQCFQSKEKIQFSMQAQVDIRKYPSHVLPHSIHFFEQQQCKAIRKILIFIYFYRKTEWNWKCLLLLRKHLVCYYQ